MISYQNRWPGLALVLKENEGLEMRPAPSLQLPKEQEGAAVREPTQTQGQEFESWPGG